MENNKIYFSIPDFWNHYKLNTSLLNIYNNEFEKFRDNIVLDSIYGSFPCIWNGGRYAPYEEDLNVEKINATLEPFIANNLGIRYTFTNCLLTEEHLNDYLCNKILEWTDKLPIERKEINVNLELLKNYIENNYPDYRLIYSTTLGRIGIDDINKKSENNLIVIDYSYNNNFDFLKQLKHPENIEILCCELCKPLCPARKNHYIAESKKQINCTSPTFHCVFDNRFTPDELKQAHIIPFDTIVERYLPLGLNKFKISGRLEYDIDVIEKYVNWLIKPEYKDEVRFKLLKSVYY